MKLNFLKQFLSAVVLLLFINGLAKSDVINFDTAAGPNQVGATLDGQTAQTTTVAIPSIEGLILTVDNITFATLEADDTALDPPLFNAVGTRFGINSGSNDFSASFSSTESLTLSFNEDVLIEGVFFGSLGSTDTISFNGTTFSSGGAAGTTATTSSAFDFTADGSTGVLLSADTELTVAAGAGNVGLRTITVSIPASVPEPSSIALLGLLSLGTIARRRR